LVYQQEKTYIVTDVTLSCTSECLNGKCLALLHLGIVAALDDWHRLAAVNGVVANAVAVEVTNALDGVCLALDLHLVALHDLLDGSANVAHAYIDTGLLDTGICRGLACLDEVVVDRVEAHSEGAVDDATVDVHAKGPSCCRRWECNAQRSG
jgi:hypothetical protein